MRISASLLAASLLAATGGDYPASIEKWRQERVTKLKAPDGWLSLAGLVWLHEGANHVRSDPAHAVVIEFQKDRASLNGKELKADKGVANIGDVEIEVIKRGGRYGVRLRDPNNAARREFSGLRYFPINERYRVQAKFVPYDPPKEIPITNVLGMTEPEKCPGYAEFTLHGAKYRLEPVIEDDEPDQLFFIFRDLTSDRESYGSGRFLYADFPKDGHVTLDFNKAFNPPCAFTAFATCPLPPHQNRLTVRIEAGEKRYGKH
ncbi:MAG: DUF1684 domain-containing protein [Acidobacteriota bacterium]|nr:DUF1684 domain-containing protein [Acidobacteriota bacterium]